MEMFSKQEEMWLRDMEQKQEKYWNISRKTAEFLYGTINNIKNMIVLEIGMSNGYSSIWIAKALKKTEGHLYSVESHQNRFEEAKHNFEKFGVSSVITMIKGHAPEIFIKAKWFQENKFDLVFLDATKIEYLSYFQKVWNQIENGGMVIADNIESHSEQLKGFVDYVSQRTDLIMENLAVGTGLLIIRKINNKV